MTTPRTMHLIDLENLIGGPVTADAATAAAATYASTIQQSTGDHVVVACNPAKGVEAGVAFPGCRLVVGHGPDGADLRLLDVATHEQIETRYERVVIASGDGIFADVAARLGHHTDVVAMAPPQAMSRRLRMAVSTTIDFHIESTPAHEAAHQLPTTIDDQDAA